MTSTAATSTASVATSGSTTYVQSTASGLDTNSLIAAAVAQKTQAADTIDTKIDANKTKISAYQNLQSLLTKLSASLTALAAPVYSSVATGNDFDTKAVSIADSSGADASSTVAAAASADAVAGQYQIEVQQLAKSMKVTGSDVAGDQALGLAGTFTIGAAGSAAATVTVTADMTVQDIAAAIAATSSTSGVTATAIRSGDGVYRLVVSATSTNAAISVSSASGDDVLTSLGVTGAGGAFADVLQAAQPSIITVDSAQISSDSNEVDDVIPGVSMTLLGESAGQTLTLTVAADNSAIKTAIQDFITAYNNVRTALSAQQATNSDGTASSDAVLFANSTLRSLTSALAGAISSSSSTSTSISTLGALGITLNSDNTLSLSDENALDSAILGQSAAVQAFFETSFISSNSSLKLLQNDTANSLSFTLDVTADASGTITGVTANGQSGMFTISGNRLVGAAGTIYDGLSFALVTSSNVSIDVSIKQGFANLTSTIANMYGDTSTGLMQAQVDNLTDTDTTLQSRADKIRDDAETYRQQLLSKYSDMETKVQAAKLLQQQIQAILGNLDNSNS